MKLPFHEFMPEAQRKKERNPPCSHNTWTTIWRVLNGHIYCPSLHSIPQLKKGRTQELTISQALGEKSLRRWICEHASLRVAHRHHPSRAMFKRSVVARSSQIIPRLFLLDLHNLQSQHPKAPQQLDPLLKPSSFGPTSRADIQIKFEKWTISIFHIASPLLIHLLRGRYTKLNSTILKLIHLSFGTVDEMQ